MGQLQAQTADAKKNCGAGLSCKKNRDCRIKNAKGTEREGICEFTGEGNQREKRCAIKEKYQCGGKFVARNKNNKYLFAPRGGCRSGYKCIASDGKEITIEKGKRHRASDPTGMCKK